MATKYTVAATLTANATGMIAGFAAAEKAAKNFQATVERATAVSAGAMDTMANNSAAMATSFDSVGDSADRNTSKLHSMRDGFDTLRMDAEAAGHSLTMLNSSLDESGSRFDGLNNHANNAKSSMNGIGSEADNAAKGTTTLGRAADLASRDLDRFNRMGRGVSMTSMGIGAAMVAGIGGSLYVFTQYESALAGVAKTTNATETELRSFDLAFREMSRNIPAGYEEIAKVAETAAQLGVQADNITEFTETMVRMGTSTNMSADEAATALAQMMNVMGTAQGDVDRLGSTIVKLGNNGASTEKDIVNMSLRIAGMGKTLGMTESDVVALASTLSDLGIKAEMGGSAISTVMSKTASAIEQGTETGQNWAKVMGMSIGQVQKLFKEDAYGALIKMVEGLEKVKDGGGNLDKTLRDLGVSELRQLDTMKRLVGGSEELAGAQRMAGAEWQNNSALIAESTKRYETFGAQLQMAWNGVKNIAANIGGAFAQADSGMMTAITNIINKVEEMTNKFFDAKGNITETGQAFVDAATKIAGIAAVLGIAGAAFMMFGPGGAIAVAVVAGIAAITKAVYDLGKAFLKSIDGSNLSNSLNQIGKDLDGVTEGKAEKFAKMRDDINQAMMDIHNQSTTSAKQTKEGIMSEIEQLTSEIIAEINDKSNQMQALTKQLMVGASEPEKQALKQSLESTRQQTREQIDLVKNAQANMNKILTGAYDERRSLTTREYSDLGAIMGSMDKIYGTHAARSVEELSKINVAFEDLSNTSSLTDIQANMDKFAQGTVKAMGELDNSYSKHKELIRSWGKDKAEEVFLLGRAKAQYEDNKQALLNNMIAYDQNGKALNKNVDITKNLTEEQRKTLGLQDQVKVKMDASANAFSIGAKAVETHRTAVKDLGDALLQQNGAMNDSAAKSRQAAEAYLGASKNVGTLKDAFNEIKTAAPEAAKGIGEGFVSSIENGVKMVDLGTAGKMKVSEFVAGVRSGEISVQEAAIAQINAMRAQIGQGSLTPEGEQKITEFVTGFQSKSATLSSVAESLGLNLKSGMKVDLGAEGQVSVESFVGGLQTGQYGAVEVMSYFQNTLKNAAKTDLTLQGTDTVNTLKTGLETGLITAQQIMTTFGTNLKTNATVDLAGEGTMTMASLVSGYQTGKITADQFFVGLKDFAKQNALADLTPEGTQTMNTFGIGLNIGLPGVTTASESAKTQVKTAFGFIDLTPEGSNVMTTFGNGMTLYSGVPANAANLAKASVETRLAATTDGQGGNNAMNFFTGGINNGAAIAQGAAGGAKAGVEATLGSTTDANGGNQAGQMFSSGVANAQGASSSAASGNKSAVESTLGSTTDGGGGNQAGSMFVSGVQGQAGNANSAGNNVSSNAKSGLSSNSDTYGLGQDFGSGFVRGIESFVGAAINAAASLARAALNAVKGEQRSNSPAKETIALGGDFGDGYILAIGNKGVEAAKAAAGMARQSISAIDDEMNRTSYSVGDLLNTGGSMSGMNATVRQAVDKTVNVNTPTVSQRVDVHIHADQEWIRGYVEKENAIDGLTSLMD